MVALLRSECSKATMLRTRHPRRRRCVTSASARQRVQPVLRRLQAVVQQPSAASAAWSTANSSSLRSAAEKSLQHEVGRVHPAGRAADAEADAQVVLGADRREIERRPLWPPSPPPCLSRRSPAAGRARRAPRCRSAGSTLKKRSQAGDRPPETFMYGPGLGEHDPRRRRAVASTTSAPALCVLNRPPTRPRREHVGDHGADVVPVAGVLPCPGLPRPTTREGPGATIRPRSGPTAPRTTPARPRVLGLGLDLRRGRRGDDVHDQQLGVGAQGGALGQRDVQARIWVPASAPSTETSICSGMFESRLDLDRCSAPG